MTSAFCDSGGGSWGEGDRWPGSGGSRVDSWEECQLEKILKTKIKSEFLRPSIHSINISCSHRQTTWDSEMQESDSAFQEFSQRVRWLL